MRKPARIVMLPVAVAIVGIVTLLAIPDRQEVTLTTILQLMPGMPEAALRQSCGAESCSITAVKTPASSLNSILRVVSFAVTSTFASLQQLKEPACG